MRCAHSWKKFMSDCSHRWKYRMAPSSTSIQLATRTARPAASTARSGRAKRRGGREAAPLRKVVVAPRLLRPVQRQAEGLADEDAHLLARDGIGRAVAP